MRRLALGRGTCVQPLTGGPVRWQGAHILDRHSGYRRAMTGLRSATAMPASEAGKTMDGTRPSHRLLVQLRVPLVCLAACLVGFLLQFGFGVPGAPVWVGVIVVE